VVKVLKISLSQVISFYKNETLKRPNDVVDWFVDTSKDAVIFRLMSEVGEYTPDTYGNGVCDTCGCRTDGERRCRECSKND